MEPDAASASLQASLTTPFEELPPDMVVCAFQVEYGHVIPPEGGDLFVTRHGWPFLNQLLPANWFADRWYEKRGEKLKGSTGHVYHVVPKPGAKDGLHIVVKFSRVAQDVPLVVDTTFPEGVPPEVIAGARFNSPMEEFGLVEELRRGVFGPPYPRILAQCPLAIYAPPEEFKRWELGRNTSQFRTHSRLLADDQEEAQKAIELDIKRIYVLIYRWIAGKDAEESFDSGDIPEREFHALAPRVAQELHERGFRVLDNKPKHFILRKRRRDGEVLRRRDGRIAYGLVDFELLQRTVEHQQQFRTRQRDRYWRLQKRQAAPTMAAKHTHLKAVNVFGVSYLYGPVPDGGRLWVVGEDPELFDYFLPERWRRTRRVKVSLTNEVYRTRTRDNIHLVYRRSRVGSQPRVDPLVEQAASIRNHGYNSPFEEVAIAERLRQMGLPTTHPRAVFRTGHYSLKSVHLRDERRFSDHAHLVAPDGSREPILRPDYDYYTIWGCFRGKSLLEPGPGNWDAVDLAKVQEESLLSSSEWEATADGIRERLGRLGLPTDGMDEELVVFVNESGSVLRDSSGGVTVVLSVDAMTAYEYDLLQENEYRALIARLVKRLQAVDCEMLNPSGKNLLLSMDLDGRFRRDERGEVEAVLCNFELIRGLYRPFR